MRKRKRNGETYKIFHLIYSTRTIQKAQRIPFKRTIYTGMQYVTMRTYCFFFFHKMHISFLNPTCNSCYLLFYLKVDSTFSNTFEWLIWFIQLFIYLFLSTVISISSVLLEIYQNRTSNLLATLLMLFLFLFCCCCCYYCFPRMK